MVRYYAAMGFFIECDKCKTVSPEVTSSRALPDGWITVVIKTGKTKDGDITSTSWQCPTCK